MKLLNILASIALMVLLTACPAKQKIEFQNALGREVQVSYNLGSIHKTIIVPAGESVVVKLVRQMDALTMTDGMRRWAYNPMILVTYGEAESGANRRHHILQLGEDFAIEELSPVKRRFSARLVK